MSDGAKQFLGQIGASEAVDEREPNARGRRQEDRRYQLQRRDLAPERDQRRYDEDARRSPPDGGHWTASTRPASPNRRFCAKTRAALSANPTMPIQMRSASINSGRSAWPAV